MKKPLSKTQQSVYSLLAKQPDGDVLIADLFAKTYGEVLRVRDMQQRLGPVIARINTKLDKGRIVPGTLKQTYRLRTKEV